MIKQDERKLAQEKAELERARKEYDANKILGDQNVVKKRELERSEANFCKSQEKIMEIKHDIEELNNSLVAVESGVFLGDGNNDSPYSKQRMDQLVIEISLAKTALNEAENRVKGIDQQIKTEKERIEHMVRHTLRSPFNSLVWRLPLSEGSTVVIGSELVVLLDCSSVFLDIAVSESQFSNVSPGEKIQYRLIGESKSHEGTVFALLGSGSEMSDANLAAALNKDKKKEFRIWVSVNPKDLDLNNENFFQVGRRVEARIPRKWRVYKEISRFFNVF
jgi:multidrug resistance efflux pump